MASAMSEGLDSHWSARSDSFPAHLRKPEKMHTCANMHGLFYLSRVANNEEILEVLGPEASVFMPCARGSTHFMTLLISVSVGSMA